MTGVGQSDVAARLQAQLDKLKAADPFRTLDVPVQVDADGVRQAYLSLTKKFHPNRFALEPAATRDLANEVFLLIRRAYDLLVDEERRRQWRERVTPAQAGPQTTARPSQTQTVTTVPGGKPSQPVATVGAMGTPTPAATQRVATLGAPRASTVGASPPPPARTITPPSGTPPRPTGPQNATAPPARNPTLTTPTVRTPTVRTPTVPGPPPAGTGTGPGTRRSSPSTGMGASPQEVQAMLDAARTRGQRFEEAVHLLVHGKYREAREAFYKIAMEDPQSKRYRIQLHYAWGLEHLADGKPAEAQRELERALALEPENHDIKSALAKAQEQLKKPSGILGKLFGR